MMIAGTVLLGIMYAGTVNIMLNGLGVVLSPAGNPGFLPGMNAGAFNLGAGLSFLVLPGSAGGDVGARRREGVLPDRRGHRPGHHRCRVRRFTPDPEAR